jgi:hypothetical protein
VSIGAIYTWAGLITIASAGFVCQERILPGQESYHIGETAHDKDDK